MRHSPPIPVRPSGMNLCRLLAIVSLWGLLTACGQRGPLYLPEPQETPAAPEDARAAGTERDADEADEG